MLNDYFAALERLKRNAPSVVPKGTKISNDAVSIEAGRAKGSIKRSRKVFHDLIEAIDHAVSEQSKPKRDTTEKLTSARTSANRYRELWEEALAREVSLLAELLETKQALAKLAGGEVLPIRKRPTKDVAGSTEGQG